MRHRASTWRSIQNMTSPASPQGPAPQGMKIRWFRPICTKLFASLILLASCTVVACAVSVWLFDGFSSLFSRTIRRDFATFGSMVRLQEEASQLVQLTASLSASLRQGQLAAVPDAITAGPGPGALRPLGFPPPAPTVRQVPPPPPTRTPASHPPP